MARRLKIEFPGESHREQLLSYAKEALRMEDIRGTVKNVELIAVVEE